MEVTLFEQYIKQGKEALQKNDPQGAMNFLGNALEIIPSQNQLELIETLFLLGVSMKRLGQLDSAQECWRSGMSLFSGMDTNAGEVHLEEEDDLFRQLHIKRYLNCREHLGFHNDAEKDYILDLIEDAWMRLVSSGALSHMEFEERLILYFDTKIAFPAKHIYHL